MTMTTMSPAAAVTGPLPPVPVDLLVGGTWHPTAERFTVDDPATLSPVASVADAGEHEPEEE